VTINISQYTSCKDTKAKRGIEGYQMGFGDIGRGGDDSSIEECGLFMCLLFRLTQKQQKYVFDFECVTSSNPR